ncbi:MAG: glycosyltransferase [Verrucomicrobiae bacterium]|nr:glycosyltransferase [Verrucomicrobiae bacterium]
MRTGQAPKVLMIAYACNPEGTGEHWLGWGWAEQAAKNHRVYLITTPNARESVERNAKIHGITVRFASVSTRLRKLTDRCGRLGSWMRKIVWAYQVERIAAEWHAQEQFALVHQTTFHSFRFPFLANRLGVPSVWGPIAGGEHVPSGFSGYIRPVYLPEPLRRIGNRLWLLWPPVQRALQRTDVLFVSNRQTLKFLGAKLAVKSVVVAPNALRPEDEKSVTPPNDSRPGSPAPGAAADDPARGLKLLYVGNCLPTRAMAMVFAALAQAALKNCELTIIGGGDGFKFWQSQARKYGVSESVKFLGRIPHAQLAQYYQQADLLVFPALRDSGGSALLEAMSKGVPVLCFDWAGPAEMVDADSGVKIPVTHPQETIRALAGALVQLDQDPARRKQLGQRALIHAQTHFTWAAKRELLEQTYERLWAAQ